MCHSNVKGWYLEAQVGISKGERVAVYPLTIKADPAWSNERHSPDDVAVAIPGANNYMPSEARQRVCIK